MVEAALFSLWKIAEDPLKENKTNAKARDLLPRLSFFSEDNMDYRLESTFNKTIKDKNSFLPFREFKEKIKLTDHIYDFEPESYWENYYNSLKYDYFDIDSDPEKINKLYFSEYNIKGYRHCKIGEYTFRNCMDYMGILFFKYYNAYEKIKESLDKENKRFEYDLKLHQRYRRRYYTGIVLWMTVCFWLPFLIGFLQGYDVATTYFHGAGVLGSMCVSGFAYICLTSFTFPVTIPLSFVMAVIGHPAILKACMFNDEHPYNESLMNALGHSSEQELKNTGSVTAGTVIGRFLK